MACPTVSEVTCNLIKLFTTIAKSFWWVVVAYWYNSIKKSFFGARNTFHLFRLVIWLLCMMEIAVVDVFETLLSVIVGLYLIPRKVCLYKD